MNLQELYEIREKLKKSIDSLAKGWASSRPDVSTDATSKIPHPKAPADRPHVRADTMKPLTYDIREEHLAKSDAGQFFVHLGIQPSEEKKGKYAQWQVSKEQLGDILNNWHKVQWDHRSMSRPSVEGKHHATAISRKILSTPIAGYLAHNKPHGRVLYHGVGRDDVGAQALGAEKYDPYHPDPKVQQQPKGPFDEVHSHYTLNVVNKDTGHAILKHIHGLLGNNGKAVISVRRDLPPATKVVTGPKVEKSLHPDQAESDILHIQDQEAERKGPALAKNIAKPEQLPTVPDLVTVENTENQAHKLDWKTKDVVLNKNQPKTKKQWHVKVKGLDGYHPVKNIIPPKTGSVANIYHLEDGRKLHQKEIEDLRM